jgi:deoxyribose-phosphate aldolase
MTNQETMEHVDLTILKQTATYRQVMEVVDKAINNNCASVCLMPCYVRDAFNRADGEINICTVIGFPNGNVATETKVFETQKAILDGASEIDMVININYLKEGNYIAVLNDIKAVREACKGKILKVIVETCLLTEDEKVKICEIVALSGADYIKTSTGFSTGGATLSDIELFKVELSKYDRNVKIKASGGIRTFEDALKFIEAGADRIGASNLG